MKRSLRVFVILALTLGGCTALKQFPEQFPDSSNRSYRAALKTLDPDYEKTLLEINTKMSDKEEQKRIRNEEIDRRLAVINANFKNFQTDLARQNVQVEFGVSVTAVGVGVAGALVSETASQILSAVSGGLAGAQAAYSKAALYEKALSALLAQMVAARKSILVEIYNGRARSIDEYPLSAAMHDLDAYYFAGSLPGAIVATAADAQVKNERASASLREITARSVTPEMFDKRKGLISAIDGLEGAKAITLVSKIETEFPEAKSFIDAQYPESIRVADKSGAKAKALLKRLVTLTVRSIDDSNKWQEALGSL